MVLQCTRFQYAKPVRNGKSRHGHERYFCRDCGHIFGDEDKRLVPAQRKEDALKHHAEDIGLRATDRLVGVSHNSVMNWVKQEVAGKAHTRQIESTSNRMRVYLALLRRKGYRYTKSIPNLRDSLLFVFHRAMHCPLTKKTGTVVCLRVFDADISISI